MMHNVPIFMWIRVGVFIAFCCTVSSVGISSEKNPAFAEIQDNPTLPRVLLIGDSISIGYTVPVRENLKRIANVHRIPENGGPTIRGLEKIDQWLGEKKWDVIHFNWGLHDVKYMEDGEHQVPIQEYKKNLEQLVKRLKKTKAKLIWCSTTPIPEGKLSPLRKPGDEVQYNEAAEQIMKKHDIMINDLYSFALSRLDKIQRKANVHFTPEGSEILGKRVAEIIKKVLESDE